MVKLGHECGAPMLGFVALLKVEEREIALSLPCEDMVTRWAYASQ